MQAVAWDRPAVESTCLYRPEWAATSISCSCSRGLQKAGFGYGNTMADYPAEKHALRSSIKTQLSSATMGRGGRLLATAN
jgi:hypothetical protein